MAGTPALAAATAVDVELVLAVDVSRSMDMDEQRVQRDGYVDAFRNPDIIQAITSGPIGQIAVTYFEWSGPDFQAVAAPWTLIRNAADAAAFADKLAAAPINREMRTSISGALGFGAAQFDGNGFTAERRAIDVSGDGPNNAGPPVVPVRDAVVAKGIVINGLPILLRPSMHADAFGLPNLDQYYQQCVVGGPGSFMIPVTETDNFRTAIRRKLIIEISGLPPRIIPAADVTSQPVDCMAGEKQRGNFGFGGNFP
ncbi:MAG: DUF1194 domain-containing protein [Bauldia sp.]